MPVNGITGKNWKRIIRNIGKYIVCNCLTISELQPLILVKKNKKRKKI